MRGNLLASRCGAGGFFPSSYAHPEACVKQNSIGAHRRQIGQAPRVSNNRHHLFDARGAAHMIRKPVTKT